VDAKTLAVGADGVLRADLIEAGKDAATPPPRFALALTALAGGSLRLRVTEPGVPRFEPPGIVQDGKVAAWAVAWDRPAVKGGVATLSADGGATRARLTLAPFKLDLLPPASAGSDAPLATLNALGGLLYEPRAGGKKENATDDVWKSHRDTVPHGPQAVGFDLAFPGAAFVAGLPERATSLALKPTVAADGAPLSEPYRLYNLDVFEYEAESPFGLYGSIPMVMAHGAGGLGAAGGKKKAGAPASTRPPTTTVGALWLNAAEMYVDVAAKSTKASDDVLHTRWLAEAGVIDVWLFGGPTPAAVAAAHATATGTTALPQRFALGYHQCRWNYRDDADTRAVDAGFDAHDIPYDVIWLDIEHTDGKRYMTWDADLFPAPATLIRDIAARGRKVVAIVDPHVKKDDGYAIYRDAKAAGHFVKDRSGAEFDGWCWPGSSAYLDVLSPRVRAWWASRFGTDAYKGSTPDLYIWNDMNEPSVFNGPEITMHKDALHDGGVEHRELHNMYGLLYHAATAAGLAARGRSVKGADGDRPFVLSRAFFSGTQTVGPIWTGDNTASWDQLRVSLPMVLTLGVAGLPFAGADVGGFFGDPDPELLTRWYQAGAFYPFFRGHAHLDTARREPWVAGEPWTGRVRAAIRERYRLLPYVYTLFRGANTTGAPVARPLFYEWPGEGGVAAVDDQFMVGGALMVAPALAPLANATARAVWLPASDRWYNASSGEEAASVKGGYRSVPTPIDAGAPAWWRGGRVVPIAERARRSSAAAARDPLTLVVALDAGGKACGDVYVDDGASHAFVRGAYVHRELCFDAATGVLSNRPAPRPPGVPAPRAAYDPAVVVGRVVVLGVPGGAKGAWTATAPGGRAVAAAPGPLTLRPGAPVVGVVVKKPDLPVGGEWDLTVRRA
jgi:alpha 1,3-glucosidase